MQRKNPARRQRWPSGSRDRHGNNRGGQYMSATSIRSVKAARTRANARKGKIRRTVPLSRSLQIGQRIVIRRNRKVRPTRITVTLPGKKPVTFTGRTSARQASFLLLPSQNPFDTFETRTAKDANRILKRMSGKIISVIAPRRPTWEHLQANNLIPAKIPASAKLSAILEWRGRKLLITGTRDDIVPKILGALGALTDKEKSFLWTGPSGKRAGARILQGDKLEWLPRSQRLEQAGTRPPKLHVTLIRN